jgi:hypothetical protein
VVVVFPVRPQAELHWMPGPVVDPWQQFDVIEACEADDGVLHLCHVVEVGQRPRPYLRYYLWCQGPGNNARTFSPGHPESNTDQITAFYANEDGVNCIACLGR